MSGSQDHPNQSSRRQVTSWTDSEQSEQDVPVQSLSATPAYERSDENDLQPTEIKAPIDPLFDSSTSVVPPSKSRRKKKGQRSRKQPRESRRARNRAFRSGSKSAEPAVIEKENELPPEPVRSSINPDSLSLEFDRLRDVLGRQVVEDHRSPNGPPVIDVPSRMNSVPWFEKGWARLDAKLGSARDYECELGQAGNLLVVGGSVRGWKHRIEGAENQDAFFIASGATSVVVAVCDGVSNATNSAEAARFLSEAVASEMAQRPVAPTEGLSMFSDEARRAIQSSCDRLQTRFVDQHRELATNFSGVSGLEFLDRLATTLTLVEVPHISNDDGRRLVRLVSVGDSPCYTLRESGWRLESAATKQGPVVDNATKVVPSSRFADSPLDVTEFLIDASDVVVVMTDGIGTALDDGDTPVGRWVAPRVRRLIGSMVESRLHDILAFDRQGEDDDRTLVAVFDIDYRGVVPDGE